MRSRTLLYQAVRRTGLGLSLLVCALALQSCKDQPLAPRPVDPSIASFSNGADQGWVRTSYNVYYEQVVPCLGGNVRVFGEVPFQLHFVANPAGGFDAHRLILPITPNAPLFHVQVISTGKLYSSVMGHPISETLHLAAGEVYSYREVDVYRADDGTSVYFTFVVHSTLNANGEPTATRLEFEDLNCG